MSNVYYILIGFLLASVLFTLFLPYIWRLSNYSSLRKIEEKNPINLDEFQADKDKLRAEFASETHHMSMTLEKLRQKNAVLSVENATAKKHINKLHNYVISAQNKIKAQQEKIIFLKKEFPHDIQHTIAESPSHKTDQHTKNEFIYDEDTINKVIKESQQEVIDVYIEKLAYTKRLLKDKTLEIEQMHEKIKMYQQALKEKNIYESQMEQKIIAYKEVEKELNGAKAQMLEYEKFLQEKQKIEMQLSEQIMDLKLQMQNNKNINERQSILQKEKLQAAIDALNTTNISLKDELKNAKEKYHQDLQQNKLEKEKQITSLEKTMSNYQSKYNEILESYNMLKKQLNDYKELSKQYQNNTASLKETLLKKEKEMSIEHQNALEKMKKENKHLIESIQDKNRRIKKQSMKNISSHGLPVIAQQNTKLDPLNLTSLESSDYDLPAKGNKSLFTNGVKNSGQSLTERIKKLRPTTSPS